MPIRIRDKFRSLTAFSVCALVSSAFGGGPEIAPNTTPNFPFVVSAGVGGSFSREANISAPASDWDTSPQGYNNNLGDSALYQVGLGYQFTPLLATNLELTGRPDFNYQKYQTSTATNTPGFIGDTTRHFELANMNLMINAFLKAQGVSEKLIARLGDSTIIQPFVGAGVGISYNELNDFYSVLATPQNGANVSSTMNEHTSSAFAWQAMAGLELICSKRFGSEMMYRYYDGGDFRSNSYITSPPQSTVAPWTGHMTSNELLWVFEYYV